MSRPWYEMRASDGDRERVNEFLQSAFAEGRLRPEEYEQRMGLVLSAKTYRDLAQLVTDLPGGDVFLRDPTARPRPPVPAGPPAWGAPPGGHSVPVAPGRGVNKHATLSMVAGLVGTFTLGVAAVIAIILGHKALREMKESGEGGYARAVTGLVFGYFMTAVWGLAWISAIFLD